MTPRFAFELDDLALLTLELAAPGDVADIDAIHEILLRRAAPSAAAPAGAEQGWAPRRPRLHVVPDPDPDPA